MRWPTDPNALMECGHPLHAYYGGTCLDCMLAAARPVELPEREMDPAWLEPCPPGSGAVIVESLGHGRLRIYGRWDAAECARESAAQRRLMPGAH